MAAAGAALYLLTAVLTFFFPVGASRPDVGGLPWFTGAVLWTLLAQAALLVVLLGVTVAIAVSTRRQPRPVASQGLSNYSGKDIVDDSALAGLGTVVLNMMAWLLASAFGAFLVLRAAAFLGTPVAGGQTVLRPDAQVVPVEYFWTVAVTLTGLAATAVVLLCLILRWWVLRARGLRRAALRLQHFPERDDRWLRKMAGKLAFRELLVGVRPIIAGLLVFTTVLLVIGAGWYVRLGLPTWLSERVTWLTILVVVGTLAVGRSAYKNPGVIGRVGGLWDAAAFWPRTTHPLAPPCYTERVMPDLLERVPQLGPGDEDVVVIVAEGQGSVIAAALVLQLDPDQRRHIRLLTSRSPLWHYSLWFPAWFGRVALHRVGQVLSVGQGPAVEPTVDGSAWPWRNLFSFADHIGGPIFNDHNNGLSDRKGVDRHVMDYADTPSEDPALQEALVQLEDWKR